MTLVRSISVLVLFLLASLARAENEKTTTPAPVPAPAPAAAPQPAPAPAEEDKLIATVNGEKVMKSDVDARFQTILSRYGAANRPSPAQIDEMKQQRWDYVVKMTVRSRLIDQLAKKESISVTDAEMDQKNEEMIQAVLKKNSITRETLEQQIQQQQGMSLNDSLEQLKKDPAFRESILAEKLISKLFPDCDKVTDEEVAQSYNENLNRLYASPELVRASHILVKVDAAASDDVKKAGREKIEKILLEVKADGADFAKLAETYSDCPSKQAGGDLNYFPRDGKMVEAFAAAAFALQTGQISGIVETQFGYHIIKVTDRKPAQTKTPEEVAPEIREQLKTQKKFKKVRDFLESQLQSDQVVYAEKPQAPAPNPMEIKPATEPAAK